ncbi:MAG: flagellar basal body protein, partial [Planctomycetota bacterium]|nr:flagellar basal body protein [Planctomycetota bacterium]
MERIDRLFTGFRIASTGLRAERTRMDVIADNIANARTSRTPEGGPYRRKLVLFEPILKRMQAGRNVTDGVRVLDVVED